MYFGYLDISAQGWFMGQTRTTEWALCVAWSCSSHSRAALHGPRIAVSAARLHCVALELLLPGCTGQTKSHCHMAGVALGLCDHSFVPGYKLEQVLWAIQHGLHATYGSLRPKGSSGDWMIQFCGPHIFDAPGYWTSIHHNLVRVTRNKWDHTPLTNVNCAMGSEISSQQFHNLPWHRFMLRIITLWNRWYTGQLGGKLLNLSLTNREELIDNMEVEIHLGDSDHDHNGRLYIVPSHSSVSPNHS